MTDEPLLVFTLRALRDSVVPHLPPMDSTSCFGGVPCAAGGAKKRSDRTAGPCVGPIPRGFHHEIPSVVRWSWSSAPLPSDGRAGPRQHGFGRGAERGRPSGRGRKGRTSRMALRLGRRQGISGRPDRRASPGNRRHARHPLEGKRRPIGSTREVRSRGIPTTEHRGKPDGLVDHAWASGGLGRRRRPARAGPRPPARARNIRERGTEAKDLVGVRRPAASPLKIVRCGRSIHARTN